MAYIARNQTKKGYHNLTPEQDEERKRENAVGCSQHFWWMIEGFRSDLGFSMSFEMHFPEFSKNPPKFWKMNRPELDLLIDRLTTYLKIKQFGKL